MCVSTCTYTYKHTYMYISTHVCTPFSHVCTTLSHPLGSHALHDTSFFLPAMVQQDPFPVLPCLPPPDGAAPRWTGV